jgi:hypothetical protein
LDSDIVISCLSGHVVPSGTTAAFVARSRNRMKCRVGIGSMREGYVNVRAAETRSRDRENRCRFEGLVIHDFQDEAVMGRDNF